MPVVWTSSALADLDEILAYTSQRYPSLAPRVALRIDVVVMRISRFPKSARRVNHRTDVRVVPVLRYPFKIFYRIIKDQVEILHIHHTAQELDTD